MRIIGLGALMGTALASLVWVTPASAFLDGRTVTVVVPSGSGGTFHLYAQLVQRHIGKHLPGKPNVVVQNRPGAGGIKAANYMASAAPKDGTVIAETNPGSVIMPLMRKVRFDPRTFNWISTLSVRTYTLGVWHDVKANTIAKQRKSQVIMGASGAGALNFQLPTFLNSVIGTKYKVIKGYKGGGAINLAMERGEVQGRGNFYSGYLGAKPHWIRDKKVQLFATIGPVRPEVKSVPRLRDIVKGDLNQKMLGLLEVGFNIGQAFYLPPGTPKAKVSAIRKAFTSLLKVKAMLAEAAKRRVLINSRPWKDNVKVVNAAFNVDKKVSKNLGKILGLKKGKKKKK